MQVLWLQTGQGSPDPFRSPRQHARLTAHLAHWRALHGSAQASQLWAAAIALCSAQTDGAAAPVRHPLVAFCQGFFKVFLFV